LENTYLTAQLPMPCISQRKALTGVAILHPVSRVSFLLSGFDTSIRIERLSGSIYKG
jgi:hypothetical protein